jgi:uncharacterized cofD-like protein
VSTPRRVCALGGGHGLATSLRAIRTYAEEVTAVVSIADDGGSSGRIRASEGGPAPGDLRRCFEALGDGSMLTAELGWRFSGGDLDGHALGNLLIAGLVGAGDDLIGALDEVGRLVGAVGRVLPATSRPVDLVADTGDWEVEGQVAVHRASGIVRLRLVPSDVESPPEVAAAITGSDQVVLGPGSFYTSILAATLAPDVVEALSVRSGPMVLVANLLADVESPVLIADQLEVLGDHGIHPDVVLVDDAFEGATSGPCLVKRAPVSAPGGLIHDPVVLGAALAACSVANL